MPAIHLTRLKKQTAQLSEQLDTPEAFIRGLYDLLETYADRTHRPGQSGEPPSLVKTFYVPKPVLRQLMVELQPFSELKPVQAISIVDALWAEFNFEFCYLAASMLGLITPDHADIILNKVDSWLAGHLENRLITIVLDQALNRIRKERPDALLSQIEIWLASSDIYYHQIGLRSLIPLISSTSFENLPIFYTMLAPFTRIAPQKIRPDISSALRSLAIRSPKETAFFLRQNLEVAENPDTALITRQVIHNFPPEIQASLRAALRASNPTR